MLWTNLDRFGVLDPWRALHELNRAASRGIAPQPGEFPLINIWTDGDGAIVTAELPGFDPANVEISVTGKTATIRGERKSEDAGADEQYHRRERWCGRFSRSIDLPYTIEADKVEARFAKGVLFLTLPRAAAEKPRKIAVKFE